MSLVALAFADAHTLELNHGGSATTASFTPADADALDEFITRYDHAAKYHHEAEFPRSGQDLHGWLTANFPSWSTLRLQLTAPAQFEVLTTEPTNAAERRLAELPWELLHDGDSFLVADAKLGFSPVRRVGTRAEPPEPGPMALSVLSVEGAVEASARARTQARAAAGRARVVVAWDPGRPCQS